MKNIQIMKKFLGDWGLGIGGWGLGGVGATPQPKAHNPPPQHQKKILNKKK